MIFSIKDAEPSSFATLSDGYAKDSKRAYQNSLEFKGKDVQTLTLLQGEFLKNKYKVYYKKLPVKDALPNSFRILNDSYARDTARIFLYGYLSDDSQSIQEVPCEASTFAILDYPYSKDAHSLLYCNHKIEGPDLASFTVIGNNFSKDKSHVYHKFSIPNYADPETFSIIVDEEDRDEFTFTKDKDHVFRENKKLKDANVFTFKIPGLVYSTDGRTVYYHAGIVQNADAAGLKSEEHSFGDYDASDKSSKYMVWVKL